MMPRQRLSDFFSDEDKTLFYFFLILLILWLIFDILKFSWSDDPFQKIVLAPVGEEAFKIVFSLFLSFFLGYYFSYLLPKIGRKYVIKFDFENVVLFSLIPFAIIVGILFGINEGPLNNIVSHFSMTAIGSILIVSIFSIVKDKPWKTGYKLLAVFSTLSIPMIIHSIHNQYANIGYAENHLGFMYLVSIAKYLQDHTGLDTQSAFTGFEFKMAFIVLFAWIFIRIFYPFFSKKELDD